MQGRIKQIIQTDFFKNVATLISGTTLAQIIALLIYPILSRIYTPEEHGLFALYMSIISITGIMATGRYEPAILMPKERNKAIDLSSISMLLALIFSIFLFFLVFFFRDTFGRWLKNDEIVKWLWFVPLSTILIAFFQVSTYWSNRNKRFNNTAIGNVTQSFINSGVKLSASKTIPSGGGLITGAIAGQIAGGLYFLFRWFKKDRADILRRRGTKLKTAREYGLFPKFNLTNNLINNISNNLPIFLLSSFFGAAEVGFFGLGFTVIFRPMNLVVTSIEQVFAQRIIEKYNQKKEIWKDIRMLIKKSIQIGFIPFLLAGIFGPIIFKFVFGPDWEEAGRYMQILIPWLFSAFIANQLAFLPNMFSRQRKAMWISIIRFILRLAGMAIGIHYHNIYLTLGLFSLVSLVTVIYIITWYISMARKYE